VVFAAVGWTVLQIGFQLYASNAGQYEAYGAVGAVLLFVTWLYFAGIIIPRRCRSQRRPIATRNRGIAAGIASLILFSVSPAQGKDYVPGSDRPRP